jgi:replicative DNA helicase
MMLPNALLRSCVHVGEPNPAVEENLRVLSRELQLEGVDGFIVEHLTHILDVSHHVPTLAELRDWCTRQELRGDARASACQARLEGLEVVSPLAGAAFVYALKEFKEAMLREGLSTALMEATTILSTGLQIQVKGPAGRWIPQNLLGAEAAVEQLSQRLSTIGQQVRGGSSEGEVRSDVVAFQHEMARRNAQPNKRGALSGIRTIDDTHNGLQAGQIAFVLGFTSHNKSTLCFNWVYRAAVLQKLNVGIVSLEMSKFALMSNMTLMHCKHPKFDQQRKNLRVSAENIRTGVFTEKQQAFFERVMDDLHTCPDYGRIFYREGSESITMTDIQRWAERLHRETPLDLLVIDYLGLVDLDKNTPGMGDASAMNRVVRQAKRMANGFANGRGIPILSPFQANRDGYDHAEKNGGRYRLTAMAWASEAEKSADVVYYVYLDEALSAANELVIGNLKNREGKVFTEQVKVFVDPDFRTVEDLAGGGHGSAGAQAVTFMDLGM